MQELFTYPTKELTQTDQVYVTIAQAIEDHDVSSEKEKIRFSHSVNQAKKKITEASFGDDIKEKLNNQLDLAAQEPQTFVNGNGATVLYVTPEDTYYYRLTVPVMDMVVVDSQPNVLPLVENRQFAQDYYLLTLNSEDIRLFKGTGPKLDQVEFNDDDAPDTIENGLGGEPKGGELNFGSYGGGGAPNFHGHNEVSAEKAKQRAAYFNIVDRYVYDNYVNEAKLPLLLFGLPENISAYREVARKDHLSEFEVEKSPSNLSIQELETMMKDVLGGIMDKKRTQLLDKFNETSPEFRIDEQLSDLAFAAVEGRIESLIIEKGLEIPGTITDEGQYNENDSANDFVNQLCTRILAADGNVYFLTDEEMPEKTRVSARLRY